MRILYTNKEGGLSIVVPSSKLSAKEMDKLAKQVVPVGTPYEIVDAADVPSDRTFRDAFKHDTSTAKRKVRVSVTKAKQIAHDKRREARAEAFKPLDVQATIPAQAVTAEAARQVIRDADAQKQIDIDAATRISQLKKLV